MAYLGIPLTDILLIIAVFCTLSIVFGTLVLLHKREVKKNKRRNTYEDFYND